MGLCLLTEGVTVLKQYLYDNMTGFSCVFTDGTCDCVKVIFIWQHDRIVALCLLTVCVTVLK